MRLVHYRQSLAATSYERLTVDNESKHLYGELRYGSEGLLYDGRIENSVKDYQHFEK